MKEHPILMSGPMVRATLEDRKTQTRRVMKLHVDAAKNPTQIAFTQSRQAPQVWYMHDAKGSISDGFLDEVVCPYGQPGDRLWVRETFCYFPDDAPDGMGECVYYRADQRDSDTEAVRVMKRNGIVWVPSIHMNRKYCRLVLELDAVRVERLRSVSALDAVAEGIYPHYSEAPDGNKFLDDEMVIEEFEELWDSLNAKRGYGWDKNPWVWVLEFKPVTDCQATRT